MKRSIFSIIKKATLVKFSGTLPFVTAIVAAVTLSLFSHAAFAADTWGYCVIVDNHGHRARFSKIFHYPFLVTKFDLKPSAERFKSDTDSGFRAAPDCLVFNDEASAVEQRNTNMELMHRFGAEAYVMDYKVKYKNYPSTPAPQLASNPAGELPQNNGGSSTTPNSINEQPRVTIQNNNQVQLPSNNSSSHQPATQMRPHSRMSTQEAIAQAQQKTRRIKLAEAKREREQAERERQRQEREKRAREKRAQEKAARERIVHNVVLTWRSKSGKWYACGPVQCTQGEGDNTEQEAMDYVLGKPRHTIVGSGRYYSCYQYATAAKWIDAVGDASEASIRRRANCRIGKVGNE